MKTCIQNLFIVLTLLAGLMQNGQAAVVFTLTPSTISNTYNGPITLQVTGLTSKDTVVVQKFLDANTNGVIDAGDTLWQQFSITEGTNLVIGGVTNINVPGDTDGTANGQITAKLNFQADFSQTIVGKYLFKLSSPAGHFTPMTNSFTVTNFPFAQKFTGTVASSGVAAPNAVVILFQGSGNSVGDDGVNPIGGAVANNSGSYAIQAAPGTYLLAAFKTNFIADTTAAADLVLGSGSTINTNLNLLATTRSITGKFVDSTSSSIGLPGLLVPILTQDGLLAVCFTDTNGNFTARVNASEWQIQNDSAAIAFEGYVAPQNGTVADATAGNVSLMNITLHKGTALFFGTVKDNFGNPLPMVVPVGASDNNNGLYQSDGYTDTNGNYVTAVVGGLGGSDPWVPQIDNSSSFPNYDFSQSPLNQNGGTNMTVGKVVLQNFTAILATNHITGHVQDSDGNPISGVGVSAGATINNVTYQAQVDTDSDGNYSMNVANGEWFPSVNCNGGDDSLDNILGSGSYECPDNQDLLISNGDGMANFTVQLCNGVQITTASPLPVGEINVPYDQFLQASSCSDNFNWSVNDPQDLPPGLQLDSFGELFGTPSTNGTFNFSVNVTDGNNNSTNQSLSLTINSPIPVLSSPVITSGHQLQLSLNGNAGNYYTIEFSTNLINWSPLLITNPPSLQPLYLDFPTTNKTGFYQAHQSGVLVGQSDFSLGVGTIGTPVFYVDITNGIAVISITRTNGLSTAVCVNYSTSDGTAIGGCDYEPQSGTLCFAVGVSSNSISIPISLGCSFTNQSATVNLQLSNGSNVLNAVLIIQRPPPVLAVFPTSLTLYVPGNCGQSITISNAGPQGSVLNYTLADDGALGGYLNFNYQGPVSPATGSLQAGQSAQVTITVLDQFATNWIGGILTTAPSIYTPGAANYVKYPLSVEIQPEQTLSIVNTNMLDFTDTTTSSIPTQTIVISNASPCGTLNYVISNNVSWIGVSQLQGSVTGTNVATISVNINDSSLYAGANYQGTIIVSDADNPTYIQSIPVSLTIANAQLQAGAADFDVPVSDSASVDATCYGGQTISQIYATNVIFPISFSTNEQASVSGNYANGAGSGTANASSSLSYSYTSSTIKASGSGTCSDQGSGANGCSSYTGDAITANEGSGVALAFNVSHLTRFQVTGAISVANGNGGRSFATLFQNIDDPNYLFDDDVSVSEQKTISESGLFTSGSLYIIEMSQGTSSGYGSGTTSASFQNITLQLLPGAGP